VFDSPRHKTIFNLPLDYPRINQFPEWFVIEADIDYRVVFQHNGTDRVFRGAELLKGMPVHITKNQQMLFEIYPLNLGTKGE